MAVPLQRITQPREVSNQRRVVREQERRPETSIADATAQFGKVAEEVALRRRDAQIQADLTKAEIRTRDGLDKLRRKIEQDPTIQPDDMESVFEQQARDLINRNSKALTTPRHREVWDTLSMEMQTSGAMSMRTAAARRSAELARASVISASEEYKRLAEDPLTSADTLAASEASLRSLGKNMAASGVLAPDQYAQLKTEIDGTARAATSLRHVSNIDQLAGMGRYGEAEAYLKANDAQIAPAQREALEEEIAVRGREGQAIAMVDSFEDRELTAAEIREEIRGIDDPEMRQMVERRRDYTARQRERVEQEAQDKVYENYGDAIWGGQLTSVMNIPRADREKLTQSQLSALDTLIKRRAQGEPIQTSNSAIAAFNDTLLNKGPEAAKTLLKDTADTYSRSDWQRYYEMATRSQASAAKGVDDPGVEVLRTRRQIITQGLRDSGLADNDDAIDQAMLGAIDQELDMRAQRWQRANGVSDAPPDEWVQQQIDELTRKIRIGRPGMLWLDQEKQARGAINFKNSSIPPEHENAVIAAFPNVKEMRQKNAEDYYTAARALLLEEREIENPTPGQITLAIQMLRDESQAALTGGGDEL